MKGFKKNGKFIPTGRNKSSLTRKDLKEFEGELDKGEQMLEQRDRLKQQGASSIQHDKLILAQKKKLNLMAKHMKLKARKKEGIDDFKKITTSNGSVLAKADPEKVKEFDDALAEAEQQRKIQDDMESKVYVGNGLALQKQYDKTDIADAKMYKLAKELGLK